MEFEPIIYHISEHDKWLIEMLKAGEEIMTPAKCIEVMITIYNPNGIDWMGYHLTDTNPYTFHHIIKDCNDGPTSVNNGAILTCNAHKKLNKLEYKVPEAYDDLNYLFRVLNASKMPPTEEHFVEVGKILKYTRNI